MQPQRIFHLHTYLSIYLDVIILKFTELKTIYRKLGGTPRRHERWCSV